MHIEHLLRDESLGLRLLWADEPHLRQEISGVTVTDLEDPARFVRPAEVVLSGLVWWTQRSGRAKADRFVSALRTAGAAVLLAGRRRTAPSRTTSSKRAAATGSPSRRSRRTSCSAPSRTRCTSSSGASSAATTPCPRTCAPR
ncbi:PucR family transcriptional regulator ligand-binding domain-containing protein [Streptomyces aureus]